ncbi:DUF1801 domain-containing protein [Halopseudomonas pertucinogena]|uniref:DUF1801 domain-containing protein n=1 Tax=Halopseudomonas pertucinogena TaxID=86175 RepID=A0ABQ2CQN5_9GAMM|nr:DUF1801 domain-containing protein [Halopseudomonas pertucinogena]GGJ02404.1 hypothetical protein GCM10009083_19110 [Halopseudomonas pertucinogena]
MKTHKPLSTKKPPAPEEDHQLIEDWIADARPAVNPVLKALDKQIGSELKNPRYAIKWGKAYYGSPGRGWCIEVAAYDISANIVFLNGNRLDPPPELGDETRYVKIRKPEELESSRLREWIRQSCSNSGWGW